MLLADLACPWHARHIASAGAQECVTNERITLAARSGAIPRGVDEQPSLHSYLGHLERNVVPRAGDVGADLVSLPRKLSPVT